MRVLLLKKVWHAGRLGFIIGLVPMEEDVFNQFLTKRYHDQLQWFEAKAATQKKRYHALQTSVVVISSAMPVMVTLMPPTQNWITATASVMLAVGTALLKMLHLPEAWINYRDTAQCLRQEQAWMEFQTGPYAEQEPPAARRKFIDRVEDILSKEAGTWRSAAMTPLPNNGSGQQNPVYGTGGGGYRQGGGNGQQQPRGDRGDRGDRQGGGQQVPPPMQQRVPHSEVDVGNG